MQFSIKLIEMYWLSLHYLLTDNFGLSLVNVFFWQIHYWKLKQCFLYAAENRKFAAHSWQRNAKFSVEIIIIYSLRPWLLMANKQFASVSPVAGLESVWILAVTKSKRAVFCYTWVLSRMQRELRYPGGPDHRLWERCWTDVLAVINYCCCALIALFVQLKWCGSGPM